MAERLGISWRGWLSVAIVVAIAVAAGVEGARRSARLPAPVRDWSNVIEAAYVGDAECARCHEEQSAKHAAMGHSQTLTMDNLCERFASIMNRDIADPERPGRFRFECLDGKFTASFAKDTLHTSEPVQFAFGSGKHAVTFLTLLDGTGGEPIALEHRLTLFHHQTETALTPSHSGLVPEQPREYLGRFKRGVDVTTCVGCHSTTGQVKGRRVDDLRAGVGCESCHGPGRKHVAARDAGLESLELAFGKGKATAQEELHLCGRCHRSPDNLSVLPDPNDPKLARFQPVGLSQSACFRRSDGALKCSTCHDPHMAVDRNIADFDGRCRQCHDSANPNHKTCAVEPAGQCTTCHMPAVEVHPGVSFHDHWIRPRGTTSPQR